ncbi:MAG: hypothetical protein GY851_15330 [bacterium]|nr:hypothetical protein [bacterium]
MSGIARMIVVVFVATVVAWPARVWAEAEAEATEIPSFLIGFSRSVPAVGDKVEARLYMDAPAGREVEIASPDGGTVVRKSNADGCFQWSPRRYGKYTFRAGDVTDTIWVTADRLYFFVWDATVVRRYVTHVLKPKDVDRATQWQRRGVDLLNWAGGEYLSREKDFGDKAFTKSEDWLANWSQASLDADFDGITIDEIYVSDRPLMAELCRSVLDFRQTAGDAFDILPFFSGIEWDAVGPMWDLREAQAPCMEENYWGGEVVYTKRWADVCLFNMDRLGAVLSQAPGFFLDEPRRGPQTVAEFRADIALCRRIAPEMRGISLFNAYGFREADHVADEVIEDYFFKPVIHLHPRDGQLMVQNIGNEDTLEGAHLEYLADDAVLQQCMIAILAPYEETALAIPAKAKQVRLNLPSGMNHVYEGGLFDLPENLAPLQVTECSIEQGATVKMDADERVTVEVRFNKPVVYSGATSVWLKGTAAGMVAVKEIVLGNDSKSLTIDLGALPEDRYSLRLLSGPNHFRDNDGHSLDGSGNGFCENAPGLFKDSDHFAVDFRVARTRP